MEEFTIYHGTLPSGRRKIGVDSKYPKRIRQQNIQDAEVLEVHTDIYEASDREQELQRLHDVKVDRTPYHQTYLSNKTDKHREKVGNANRGKKLSEETKRKLSESQKGIKRGPMEIITCPHCGKSGGNSPMKQWHFDNCRSK